MLNVQCLCILEYCRFSDTAYKARHTDWIAKLYREKLSSVGKQIIRGAQECEMDICFFGPGERSECPFCNDEFADYNALIDNLLLTCYAHLSGNINMNEQLKQNDIYLD